MGFEKEQRPFLGERYIIGEQKTQSRWVDDKPIYRRVVQFTGAANQSTITVAALANAIDTIITAVWSVLDGTTEFRINQIVSAATSVVTGISITESSGLIVINHDGLTFTGETISVILEYTKQ